MIVCDKCKKTINTNEKYTKGIATDQYEWLLYNFCLPCFRRAAALDANEGGNAVYEWIHEDER